MAAQRQRHQQWQPRRRRPPAVETNKLPNIFSFILFFLSVASLVNAINSILRFFYLEALMLLCAG